MNESFSGLQEKVKQRIPCLCATCRTLTTPHFFNQKNLRKRVEDRRLNVECPESYEEVRVLALLDGISAEALRTSFQPALNSGATRTIRIFLASSFELRKDRDAFDLKMRQLNDRLGKRGIYLRIVRWEHFLDAMSGSNSRTNTIMRQASARVRHPLLHQNWKIHRGRVHNRPRPLHE